MTLLRKRFSRPVRRLTYGLMALVTAVSVNLAIPQPSHAGLLDFLFNGIQYIQLSNLNDRQEVELGQNIDRQLKAQGLPVYRQDSEISRYVNSIGQRLASNSARPNIPYTFQVVRDDSINAFATMGGFVYIHTGLIEAADNEAELAGVVAHEIGHITGRHAVNQMRDMALASGIAGALGVNQDDLVNLGVQLALQLPNSRSDEYDADRRGFETMGRAGYAQEGLVSFMRKLEGQGGNPPEFLSTHPNPGNRVGNLQQMLNSSNNPGANDGLDANAYAARTSSL
ncbi:peptidase M48 [filamentous cyanobacterium CCP5]|nr:peptidase M48 [filamentous cyanobacterium CCP5]